MDETNVRLFWDKVDKAGPVPEHYPELGPCWVWTAHTVRGGYGQMSLQGKNRAAHRASWEIRNGAIPGGLCVLHKCDNPPCVRPSHLWLGTKADNNADMVAKGRSCIGERNPKAKLDDFSARLVRRLHKRGLSPSMLGRVFGVSQSVASKVCLGKLWRHVS